MLTPPDQALFLRLSVFVGGFGEAAATAVAGATFDDLVALTDKSLLRQGEDVAGSPRWGMLESIRAFGLEQLQAGGTEDAIRTRHVDYYLQSIEQLNAVSQASALDSEADTVQKLDYYAVEGGNLASALHWALQSGHPALIERLGGVMWELGWATVLDGPTAAGWTWGW